MGKLRSMTTDPDTNMDTGLAILKNWGYGPDSGHIQNTYQHFHNIFNCFLYKYCIHTQPKLALYFEIITFYYSAIIISYTFAAGGQLDTLGISVSHVPDRFDIDTATT
jgi:hypothetical protein